MMKNILLLIGLYLLLSHVAMSQRRNKLIDMAGDYYSTAQYLPAAEIYNDIVKSEPNNLKAKYQLAQCHRLLFNYNEAEPLYKEVFQAEQEIYPYALFYLALCQKLNRKYQKAIEHFLQFEQVDIDIKEFPQSHELKLQAQVERKGCELALKQEKMPKRDFNFKLMQEPVNTAFNDYAPVIFSEDSIIALSSGRATKKGQIDPRLGEALSNNYLFVNQDNDWKESKYKNKFDKLNSKYGDGAGFLLGENFYFTSCQEADGSCAIYVTTLKKGKWQKPEKLGKNINKEGTDNKQPNLSSSGDTLIFVSDRPGGMGKNDLWMSIKNGETWGIPENLGPTINTPFNEISPFYYSEENLLFFASDGHYGFGGLDVYMSTSLDFTSFEILNIGLPFNSNGDDCYFTLGNQNGYLASNRKNGLGRFDIYSFKKEAEETVIAEIANNMPYAHRDLAYNDESFKFYQLSEGQKSLVAENKPTESYSVSGKLVDEETGQPVANATIPMVDKNGELLKTTKTNEDGEFRYQDMESDDSRILAKQGNTSLTSKQNLKVENLKIEPGLKNGSRSSIESIYFDFNSDRLRKEAQLALEDLVDFYFHFPHVQIEIDAHTDNIGNPSYNKHLSEQRGKIVYNYLINRGIDASALVINARGQSSPYASNQTLLGRQLNRRVEFKIKGISDKLNYPTATYIIKPKANLYRIAKTFQMSVAEVMLLNGLKSKNIRAYSPVRVYNKTGPDARYVFVPLNHSVDQNIEMSRMNADINLH